MKKNSNTNGLIIILICLAVIFHELFEQICNNLLVEPFLSRVSFNNSFISQIALLTLLGVCMFWGWRKIKIGFQFAKSWLLWSLLLAIVYLYYRNRGVPWYFYPFLKDSSVKAADSLFLLPLYFLIIFLVEEVRIRNTKDRKKGAKRKAAEQHGTRAPESFGLGFKHDSSIIIDKKSDEQERHRFVEQLKERIIDTSPGKSSFCIGVVGPWGAGKTTFLNTLKKEFRGSSEMIQVVFDPWINQENGSLTEHFLTNLSITLSEHTDLLGTNLKKYARSLVKSDQRSIWGIAAQVVFPLFNWKMSTVDELKENIANALQKINKRIIIFIDDIDRLDQQEIQEVFRLIRNVAGFPNMFYIVAFDKLQVENSLKGRFDLGYNRYLEKIFQVEFYLPPAKGTILLKHLTAELSTRLDQKEKALMYYLFRESEWGDLEASYTWMGDYLQNNRDINRYVNQFALHHTFVNGEVFLPDFLVMTLLRLKYPDFYYHLYRNRYKYLTFRDTQSIFENEGEFVLRCKDDTAFNLDNTVLKKDLESGLPELGIPNNDMTPLKILHYIFDINKPSRLLESFPRARTGFKAHLSAIYSQYFSRYFDYSFTGTLSDVEFENAINSDKIFFIRKVEDWCLEESVGNEVIDALERYTEFPDLATFDKVVSALLLIATSKFNNKEYRVDRTRFLRLFNMKANNKPKKIFASHNEAGKYMENILESHCNVGNWCYNLVKDAANEVDGFYYTSKIDLFKIIERTCEAYFHANPTIDHNLLAYMLDWKHAASAIGSTYPLPIIRDYLIEHMADIVSLFIGPCPRHTYNGSYILYKEWINIFFSSELQFTESIRNLGSDIAKELDAFIAAIELSETDCTPFIFKHLAIPPIAMNYSDTQEASWD